MLDEFIEFTYSLFPSISPYVKDETKRAIEQFGLSENKQSFFNEEAYTFLSQGDIFDGIPFSKLDEKGEIFVNKCKGMIISNTCSADHDDDIVIAPLLDIDNLGLKRQDIVNNLHYRLLYIPDERYKDYVVDFSLINTFNKNFLNNMLNSGKINKESSLNQFGYYFFICKLTVCFLRPEDVDVQKNRRDNYNTLHNSIV